MHVRVYLRRSKNDEGKQQFSLDVQRAGCREFIDRLALGEREIVEYVDDGRRATTSTAGRASDACWRTRRPGTSSSAAISPDSVAMRSR